MKIGTLFSGIGSPEQGAKRVYNDLELVFACEWDKYARESFNANYEIEEKHFHKDIADMDGKQYQGQVDILIGGSPCQDFSLAGLRKGIEGNKGILIYEYIRIIEEVQPPIFIYENVKGMLSDKGGRTIKDFVQAFRDMGYHCHYEVLNTKDYGVPQNRERIFLVGFKDSEHYHNFSFAPKLKLNVFLKDLIEKEVDEKYFLSDKACEYIFDSVRLKKKFTGLNNSEILTLMAQYSSSMAGTFLCVDTNGRVDTETINTITARYYKGIEKYGTNPFFYSGIWHMFRKMTPRECFRFQDFPDTFKFVVSNSQLYKQAGNSISVNIMEMIFNQIELSRNGNQNKDTLF